jgi:hypothetical protein
MLLYVYTTCFCKALQAPLAHLTSFARNPFLNRHPPKSVLPFVASLPQAHGILQVVVWVFFFPAGVLSARYLKHRDPLWWHLHRGFQSLGFVLFLVAMGLSLKAKALNGTYSTAHKALGVFLLVAVILQASRKSSRS